MMPTRSPESSIAFGRGGHEPGSRVLRFLNWSRNFFIGNQLLAAGALGAALPALAGSSACRRLRLTFMLNSETRLLLTVTALISTSSGFSRYGDAEKLRISVETRAFDCEYPRRLTFSPVCLIAFRYTPSGTC